MRKLLQITLQEKSPHEWRGFCICREGNDRWELQSFGASPGEAAENAYKLFNSENWSEYGHKQFGKS